MYADCARVEQFLDHGRMVGRDEPFKNIGRASDFEALHADIVFKRNGNAPERSIAVSLAVDGPGFARNVGADPAFIRVAFADALGKGLQRVFLCAFVLAKTFGQA